MSTVIAAATAWSLAFATHYSPLDTKWWYPNNVETKEERLVRYESIESDIWEVVFDPSEKPLFVGKNPRLFTVALVNSIISHESSYRKDVDTGIGKYANGDKGASVCLMQINIGNTTLVIGDKKWTREQLRDRKECIRAGLANIRESIRMCGKVNPKERWLSAYAGGKCQGNADADKKAADRWNRAVTWYAQNIPSFSDDDVMAAFDAKRNPVSAIW